MMRVFLKTMKHYYLYIILLLLSLQSRAQNSQALYIAKYHYAVVTDTSKPGNVYREDMMLMIGKSSSLFKSYSSFQHDSLIMAQTTLNMAVFNNSRQYTDDQVLNIYSGVTGYASKKIGLRYYWEITMPRYDWKILPDTATIAGFKCEKAVMFSQKTKRNYTAWFTSEIPIPAGPSYMNGLPGLIVRYEDANKTIMMEMYAFTKVANADETVAFDRRAIKTTKADFEKALAAYKSDPTAFLNASGALNGTITQPTPDK